MPTNHESGFKIGKTFNLVSWANLDNFKNADVVSR